jgi:hypothetical protein
VPGIFLLVDGAPLQIAVDDALIEVAGIQMLLVFL